MNTSRILKLTVDNLENLDIEHGLKELIAMQDSAERRELEVVRLESPDVAPLFELRGRDGITISGDIPELLTFLRGGCQWEPKVMTHYADGENIFIQ